MFWLGWVGVGWLGSFCGFLNFGFVLFAGVYWFFWRVVCFFFCGWFGFFFGLVGFGFFCWCFFSQMISKLGASCFQISFQHMNARAGSYLRNPRLWHNVYLRD